jgi:hypothetical protein
MPSKNVDAADEIFREIILILEEHFAACCRYVACLMKARTVKPAETADDRERLCNHACY